MAADLLDKTGWSAANATHDYTALVGEFGGTPHLVGLAMVGGGDHIVLVAPGGLRSTLESADEYIAHSVRLVRIRDRLVATRTKVPAIFLEVPATMVGDFEAFGDYEREDFVPFCQRLRKAMPLAADVLGADRGVPVESEDAEEAAATTAGDVGALASSADDYAHLGLRGGAGRLGAHQTELLHMSREARPSVVVESHQKDIEKDLGVLAGEAWSYGRRARERVLP